MQSIGIDHGVVEHYRSSLSIPLRDAHLIISLRTCVTFDPNYCPVNKEDYTEVAVITRPPRQFVSLHRISIIIYV